MDSKNTIIHEPIKENERTETGGDCIAGETAGKRAPKALKDLNLCDDFLFDVVTEDLDSCKDILEMILGWDIKEIRQHENQKVVHNQPGKRGIRMDFFVEDAQGDIFDVEMQVENRGNIPKRTRFYQSLVDVPQLKSGERGFDNLKPVYIIVICGFDLFGLGLYEYSFRNLCDQAAELELGDESYKIILNTKGTQGESVRQTLIDFLRYVDNSSEESLRPDSDQRLIKLHKKICAIKARADVEVSYMTMEERDAMIEDRGLERGLKQGLKRGLEQGHQEGREITLIGQVCRKLKKGKSAETIAGELEEEIPVIAPICKAAQCFAPEYDCQEIYKKLHES